MSTTDPEAILTPSEVARMLRVTVPTVYDWARKDQLPGFRTPGKQWRFHRSDVEDFLKGRES